MSEYSIWIRKCCGNSYLVPTEWVPKDDMVVTAADMTEVNSQVSVNTVSTVHFYVLCNFEKIR